MHAERPKPPTRFEVITERPLMTGYSKDAGFTFTQRSDGRFEYSVSVPGKWVEAGSEATLLAAQMSVSRAIERQAA